MGTRWDAVALELGGELLKVWETLAVDGEALVALHVVDVHVDGIEGDARLAVAARDVTEVILRLIGPAALLVAEGPLGRDVASAHERAELADDVGGVLALDKVEVAVGVFERDLDAINVGLAHVEGDDARGVEEGAEGLAPRSR